MSDLTGFLLARIAEDEAVRVTRFREGHLPTPRELREADRWEAECDAKRRIVEAHQPADRWPRLHPGRETVCSTCSPDPGIEFEVEPWPCPTLRALAAVYADPPDYDEAWRP